jgi:hypothetical protein
VRHQIQQAAGLIQVIAHVLGARDRVGGIRDAPISPPAHLIAENTEPGQDGTADRSFDDDASRYHPVGIGDRPGILDDETPFR